MLLWRTPKRRLYASCRLFFSHSKASKCVIKSNYEKRYPKKMSCIAQSDPGRVLASPTSSLWKSTKNGFSPSLLLSSDIIRMWLSFNVKERRQSGPYQEKSRFLSSYQHQRRMTSYSWRDTFSGSLGSAWQFPYPSGTEQFLNTYCCDLIIECLRFWNQLAVSS